MNLVIIVHLVAAILGTVAAVPLIRGKVKMNPWYGVRIPAAFESEARWYEINRYGGRLILAWGVVIAATALIGAFLPQRAWIAYDFASLAVITVGLVLVIVRIYRHASANRR
ncbi:MAG TPA: SdpI family protein [Phycisphaerae bacterium]|nr:SdpI family protein [Phycisphaerae bacterium]